MSKKKKMWIKISVVIAVVAFVWGFLAYKDYQYREEQRISSLNMTARHRGEIIHVAEMREGGYLIYLYGPGYNISGELREYWVTDESFVEEKLMQELKDRKAGAYVEIYCYSTPREGLVSGHAVRPVIDISYYEE